MLKSYLGYIGLSKIIIKILPFFFSTYFNMAARNFKTRYVAQNIIYAG